MSKYTFNFNNSDNYEDNSFSVECSSIGTALNALGRSEHIGREISGAYHGGSINGRIVLDELVGKTVPPYEKKTKKKDEAGFDFLVDVDRQCSDKSKNQH